MEDKDSVTESGVKSVQSSQSLFEGWVLLVQYHQ